ncbi:MAG: T9SS type A sorting domain-containing protein [Chitinophagaceae bacterium]
MKNQSIFSRLFAGLFFLLAFSPVFSKTYYVNASTGNDSNTGLNISSSFLTIQKALNTASAKGDIILVSPGTYTENLVWKYSGTNAKKMILQKNGAGIVYLKSPNTPAMPVLEITNMSNIIIDGFFITRDAPINNAQGILVQSSGNTAMKNIEIKNCSFTNINWSNDPNIKPKATQNAQPFIVYGRSSVSIKNISIHDCDFNNNITGQSEVCSFNANIDGFSATNNVLHDNTNIAIDVIGYEGENNNINLDQAKNGIISNNILYNNQSPYSEGASIYVDGGASVLIENNIIHDGDYGIEISGENDKPTIDFETQDITVRNNLIYNCRSAGLKIGNYKGKLKNALVSNNTCFYNNRGGKRDGDVNGTSRKISPWAELVIDNMEDVNINSNIFYARASNKTMLNTDANALIDNLTMDYNLWYNKDNAAGNNLTFQFKINNVNNNYNSFSNYISNTSNYDHNAIYGDPDFVNENIAGNNAVNPDLHISMGSLAQEKGDPNAVIGAGRGFWGIEDFFGNARIAGILDMGAHELPVANKLLPKNISVIQIEITPNPVDHFANISNLPDEEFLCRITDLSGKICFNQKIQKGNNHQLDLSKLKPGFYAIVFIGKNGLFKGTFLKK